MKFTRPKISKKKIAVFSVFIVIATIFWFLNALNREYITNIKYPVQFYNIPKNISPSVNVPQEFTVNVKAYGFDILWKITASRPLRINVGENAVKDEDDDSKLLLSTLSFKNDLFPEKNDIEVINIKPEFIVFSSQNLVTKKVPIKINVKYTTDVLHMVSGPLRIKPDSILAYGSEQMIEKIEFVETETVNFSDLNDSLLTVIKLKKLDSIVFEKSFVNMLIPVEKYTENTTTVQLEIKNCPDSLRLVTFPKEVKIRYNVTLSLFNSIQAGDFKAGVDFSETIDDTDDKLEVKIEKSPLGIDKIAVIPNYIEYIIEKKDGNNQ